MLQYDVILSNGFHLTVTENFEYIILNILSIDSKCVVTV